MPDLRGRITKKIENKLETKQQHNLRKFFSSTDNHIFNILLSKKNRLLLHGTTYITTLIKF